MPFKKMPGVTGLVYVREEIGKKKKHPCKDCYCCQWCSDNRCEMCLKKQCCKKDKNKDGDK